jgi:S-formylglutathione hydrolase FrmB
VTRVVIALAAALGLAVAPAASAVTFRDAHGLQVTSVKQLNSRLDALVVKTKAVPAPLNVYILFPPDYATHPNKRFPVFYLLHGTSGTASDWTKLGDAQQVIGNREMITVMPDIAINDGGGGWCTNWPNGDQAWETFHINQLVPWVDSNLRTKPQRSQRAIAGLSQGGFCSMSYAARHPDLFSVALGYSGAPDIYYDARDRVGAKGVINATEVGLDGVPPDTFFGDQATDGINWAAHDPATLAENLRWTKMYMYWGNGMDGPFDQPGSFGGGNGIEELINYDNQDFQARIQSLGIAAYFDPYGNGTHSWPYWKRDLQWSIAAIAADFAHPSPPPSPFTYTSGDDAYSVYGWSVTMHRTAREFSTLENVSKRGFALAGSGSGTVVTPAVYSPGTSYRVTLSGDKVASHTITVTAGRGRRLRLDVTLGPSNPDQQDTPQAQAAGTVVYTTTVRIAAQQS